MHLESLRIYNFRNLENTDIAFTPGLNFLIGKNGQGKTNLVEAIHFLSSGRSFRTQKSRELIRHEEKEASVFGTVYHQNWDVELGVSLQSKKRSAYINGDTVKTFREYLGKLICVSFSPGDLALIKGAPGERRKFIDRYLSYLDPIYFDVLLKYNKALQHKRSLLHEDRPSRQEIGTWNEMLADWIVQLNALREEFLKKIEERAQKTYADLAPEDPPLNLSLSHEGIEESAGLTASDINRLLEENFERESRRRSCLIGPHRDDLEVCLGKHTSRSFASQGQTRSIVLSLLSAVIDLIKDQTSEFPVLLLDDVESELDASRNEALVNIVSDKNTQVIITGTDVKMLSREMEREQATYLVEEGKIVTHNN